MRRCFAWAMVFVSVIGVVCEAIAFGGQPALSGVATKEAGDLRNSVGMDFQLIPAGTFQMGSADPKAFKIEQPVHEVRISRPFFLGTTEVTNGQWKAVMGGEPPSKLTDAALPVHDVNWGQAIEFCERLSGLPEERNEGRVYRLPTEAEWEYACRAGTNTRWSWGDDEEGLEQFAFASFGENRRLLPQPAGKKKPNAWGLYDMHGNVLEWCSDWYEDYQAEAAIDPTGPARGLKRVTRGGCWASPARGCWSAFRMSFDPSACSPIIGFRVAFSSSDSEGAVGEK